ncbi:MAG: hypothetical protein EA350_09365 [Gemmatimonadales bacterium]|nr:MAG: hypothetical protein EA350_09365 [Gemmatimonadales bacterium]
MSGSLEGLRSWVRGSGDAPALRSRAGVTLLAGGKGGVGTSTLAALLGARIAHRGSRTLLVELAPGGLHLLLGIGGEVAGLSELATPGVSAESLVRPVAERLDLLPAGPPAVDGLGTAHLSLLLRKVVELFANYDRVVVDAGSRADLVIPAGLAGAAELWVVTQQDRVAAAGAYALLKVASHRLPGLPVRLLVNRATPGEARSVAGSVADAAATFLGLEVGPELAVPVDGSLPGHTLAGHSLAERASSPVARTLADAVLPLPDVLGRGTPGEAAGSRPEGSPYRDPDASSGLVGTGGLRPVSTTPRPALRIHHKALS